MRKLLSGCILYSLVIVGIMGCRNEEGNGSSKDVDQDKIFFDYQVLGDEENYQVTVLLQYRLGGPRGHTLMLESPSNVELDGIPFPTDSTKMTGAYYELQFPADSFAGEHTIVFTDMNGKKYSETFHFMPVVLTSAQGDTISQDAGLEFVVQGLDSVDYVRIVMTDTSRFNEGINRLDTIRDGRLVISPDDLRELSPGPLQLVLTRENEKPVKNGSPKGGRVAISYALRRELQLR